MFCEKGYGINLFREQVTDPNLEMSKERYKSVMGTSVRLGFRNIETFLLMKMKRSTSALKRVEAKAMLTPLLNFRSVFN